MLTLELSAYAVGIPYDAYTTPSLNTQSRVQRADWL